MLVRMGNLTKVAFDTISKCVLRKIEIYLSSIHSVN